MANNNSPFSTAPIKSIYQNTEQNVISITEDKLKVILLEYKEKNKLFYSWTTPLGIFISCLLATITSNFVDTLGLSASTWQAVFIMSTIGTGGWLIYAIYYAFNNKKRRSLEDLKKKKKNGDTSI